MKKLSKLGNIFAAAALSAGAILLAGRGAEASFSTGSQCRGTDCVFHLGLEDRAGGSYAVKLPMPDKDPDGFREQVISVLKEFVDMRGGKFDDLQDDSAASFKFMLERIAEEGKIPLDTLRRKTGITDAAYEDVTYRAYRFSVLRDRIYLQNAARVNNPKMIGWGFDSNEETIKKSNDALSEAARKYPNEPAFQAPPLTEEDLRAVRRNGALVLATNGLRLLKEIDSGFLNEKTIPEEKLYQVTNIVDFLYNRADDEWTFKKGEKYNSELPAMFDRALAMNGCRNTCKTDFYRRMVDIYNYYNRAKPVTIPAPQGPAAAAAAVLPRP